MCERWPRGGREKEPSGCSADGRGRERGSHEKEEDGERECTKRGWVEGIISPMQIAFGLRLTEYTLELVLREFRPPYFPRERAVASVCTRS